jgi:hypothetical protein
MPLTGAYGVASLSRVVSGVIMVGQTLIECNELEYSLEPMYSGERHGIYIGTRCTFSGRVVAMCYGSASGGGGFGHVNQIYNALLAAASPYGIPQGSTGEVHEHLSKFFGGGDAKPDIAPYEFPEQKADFDFSDAGSASGNRLNYKMITESEDGDISTTGTLTVVGKSFGITIGGNQPEDSLNGGTVNGLYVPAPNMLSPLYVRATLHKVDAHTAELVVSGFFTFYHGEARKAPFALLHYDTGMRYQIGHPVGSFINITVRYLTRDWPGNLRALGAMQYVPRLGGTLSFVNSIQVNPHADGMGMTISIEFVHDNLIFNSSARHKGVLAVHVIEDTSVVPPKSGYAITSNLAGAERGLLTNAQNQELFNQYARLAGTALDVQHGLASDAIDAAQSFLTFDVFGLAKSGLNAAARARKGALSGFTQMANIGFTHARHHYQNMAFSIQKQVELSNLVVRNVNITVFGIPGAWPGELACFAANVANYFFMHWIRLAASGIAKKTLYKNKDVYATKLKLMLQAIGLFDTDTTKGDVMLASMLRYALVGVGGFMGVAFGGVAGGIAGAGLTDLIITATKKVADDRKYTKAAKALAQQGAYNVALSGLSSANIRESVGAIPASFTTALLGELFRVIGLEGISVDTRYDHLSCVYTVSVKVMFSDALVYGLPTFFTQSISNAMDLSNSWGNTNQFTMTRDGKLKSPIPALQAWIPYPVSLGYNSVGHGLEPKASRMFDDLVRDNLNAAIANVKTAFDNAVVWQHLPSNFVAVVSDPVDGAVHREVKADNDRGTIYQNVWQKRNYIAQLLAGQTGVTFERLRTGTKSHYNVVTEALDNIAQANTADRLPLSPTASVIWYLYNINP